MHGRIVALGACLLLMAAGCSAGAEAGGSEPPSTEAALGGKVPGERMTGAELCEMVPASVVADLFAVEIADTTSKEWDTARKTSASCEHRTAGSGLTLSVNVAVQVSREPAGDLVEKTFTHPYNGNGVEYQRVDGLGDAAGFGPEPLIPDLHVLDVVTEHEGARRSVSVYVQYREASVAQVRPVAERVLQELDG